jgi:uncharacterized protein (TIGR00725 family)
MPQVAVIGPGEATPEQMRQAWLVGAHLARRGVVVVTGGLGGVMAAASRGAAEAGGLTIGLLPGADATAANPWVLVAVPTDLGQARNALVVGAADVVLAVGGGWGTLSELALAVRAGVPVVGLASWEPAPPEGSGSSPVHRAATVDDAVGKVFDLLGLDGGEHGHAKA